MSLEALRKKAGITQIELERISGVKQGTISKIERGETDEPSLTTLRNLRAAFATFGFDVSFDELVNRTNSAA